MVFSRTGLLVCVLAAAASPTPQQPGCEAPVWGDTVTVFDSRVKAYVALRDKLEASLPRPIATGTVAEVGSARRALAAKIRAARGRARQGNLFGAEITAEIRKSLRRAIDAHTWKDIMDDNPGEMPSQVNDEYRDGSPFTTMPPNVLAALPRLPQGIEYRFVERHLILLDTRALVIVDRIPYAIGDPGSEGSCR
jgi:hypothetical protein